MTRAARKVIKDTGAKYEVMDADVPVVESGGKLDFNYGDKGGENLYPPTKVDRVLHDGDKVSLGGTVLTAHKTPGHTKGCTTWTMQVKDGGKTLNVVIVGSPNVNPGYILVGNKKYPGIVQDYEKTFRVLKALPADVFLGAHGDYYGMEAKYAKLTPGGRQSLHRSRRLQGLYRQSRSRLPQEVGAATGRRQAMIRMTGPTRRDALGAAATLAALAAAACFRRDNRGPGRLRHQSGHLVQAGSFRATLSAGAQAGLQDHRILDGGPGQRHPCL